MGASVEALPSALAELEAGEITAEDLEAFREQLPTDADRAVLVERWLPAPWSDVFEYVQASERQSAYWRVRPPRRRPRSAAEIERSRRFRAAAKQAEGVRGTVEVDGQEIPASARVIQRELDGETYAEEDDAVSESGRKALSRLREILGV